MKLPLIRDERQRSAMAQRRSRAAVAGNKLTPVAASSAAALTAPTSEPRGPALAPTLKGSAMEQDRKTRQSPARSGALDPPNHAVTEENFPADDPDRHMFQ